MAKDTRDIAYSQLVDAIYETALQPSNYLKFAEIWDDQIVDPILADNNFSSDIVDVEKLKLHFERALKVFEKTKLKHENLVQNFLDQQKFAAAVAHLDGSLIAGNVAFTDRFGLEIGQSFYHHAEKLTPSSSSGGQNDLAHWNDPAEPIVAARYFLPDGKETIVIVEKLIEHQFEEIDTESLLFIKSCHAEWMESGANIFKQSFGFTEAEMAIAKSLYKGQRSGEIAAERNRATATVQKQIKSLLSKAQVASQSEFISLAIGLMHVVDVAPTFLDDGVERNFHRESFKNVEIKNLRNDRSLQFAHYGHSNGDPILFLHAHTSSAVPTEAIFNAATAENLQIVAPCKPGAGQSSPDNGKFEPMEFVEECLRLLDHLRIERAALAGHAMSGVYAIKAAERFPDRFSAVGLLDTGIPMTLQEQFEDMPEASRRIFLAAKNTPDLLYAPFAFAAASATKDTEGQRAFMKNQFAESPNCTALLKLPHIYQPASKAMLDYMNTPRRSVDELIYWVSDWTGSFRSVAERMPILFVQSELHEWLNYQRTIDFCVQNAAAHCAAIDGTGELLTFDRPKAFCRTLATLVRLGTS